MKDIIVNKYPKSAFAEAIKSIKTNLKFSSINNEIKTILVTSSVAGEGKSFITANLAAIYANSNEKTLIIDCDLRRGTQKNIFDLSVSSKNGLSNLLIDKDWKKKLEKYINKTKIENLDVMTSGIFPSNPSALLESKKMNDIVEELKSQYSYIIIDTPPVIGINDAPILSRLADTVIIVSRAKKATVDMLEETKEILSRVNVNIAGVVLNRKSKIKNYNNNYYLD